MPNDDSSHVSKSRLQLMLREQMSQPYISIHLLKREGEQGHFARRWVGDCILRPGLGHTNGIGG